MSYSDKDLGEILPVRNGEAQGTAAERVMLDTVNDTTNFRTRVQDNGDGSQTTLRTKGGMPQFYTDGKKKTVTTPGYRTFVFAQRSDPTNGNRVANRNPATNKLLIKTKELAAAAMVSYVIMRSVTATTNAGVDSGKWNDVVRLDDTLVKINTETYQPNSLARMSESMEPGHPVLINRPHVNPALLPLFVGSNREFTTSGATKTCKQGVATYKSDGSLFSFTQATGPVALNEVNGSGVRITQASDSNGLITASFHFNWQGENPSGSAGATTTCYCRIDVSRVSTPIVNATQYVETKLANIAFDTANYNAVSPSVSEQVVGFFYSWFKENFSGPYFPLNVYGWCAYSFTLSLDGMKNVYSDYTSSGWSKSISFSDTYSLGFDVNALDVSRSVSGSEGTTDRSGGGHTPDYVKYYVSASGNDSTWTRNTSSVVSVRLSAIADDLYKAQYTCNSVLHYGQLRIPTVSWNFDAFDQAEKHPTGNLWVYIPSNPTYSAVSEAKINEFIAYNNAQAAANAAASYLPPEYGSPIGTPSVDYGAYNDDSTRTDGDAFSLLTRDYVYFDYEENVHLSLVMEISSTRTNYENPIVTGEMDEIHWDATTCSISIYFELNVRGSKATYSVYQNDNGWGPDIAFYPVGKTGSVQWEDTFSGAHIPGEPSLSFQPLYTHQGRCPWIAYTTIDEEASGATPEFYMDVKLYPAIGAGRMYTGDSLETPVVFPAPHMVAGFANYMGRYAPANFFTDILFPTPFRIRKAVGIGDPWINQLEAPFSTETHIAISRI